MSVINIRYFEIEFGKSSEIENREFIQVPDRLFICIKADHEVSVEEVEDFCKEDMEENGYDTICSIIELSEEEACDSYDMTDGDLPILTKSGKNVYKIPVSYEVYGYVYIEADSVEDACEIAEEDDTPLPDNADYIEGSWKVDWEIAEEIN